MYFVDKIFEALIVDLVEGQEAMEGVVEDVAQVGGLRSNGNVIKLTGAPKNI